MLCLSLSRTPRLRNYHTSSNCPLRTAAAILSRRSATPPLSGAAEAGGEGARGGGDSGTIVSFALQRWFASESPTQAFFFFFPSTGTTRAERERERDTKIKRQRGSDPSFSLRALLRSLCTPMSLTTIDKKERRRARKKRVASKKREKSEQSSPRKKVERRKSLSLVSRERLLSFILSLSTALPFQHHVGASCPAAVPRSGGRVQR